MKLEILNLSKSYGANPVFKDINFTFESGRIYGLIGKNGAGKTTFFNCLNGSITRNSGESELVKDDGTIQKLTQDNVGFVASTPVLPEFLTGKEFVKFLLDVQDGYKKMSMESLFSVVKLNEEEQERLIKTYSHGMKTKLQMLSFIICDSPVLFLDEPLTSLDVVVAADIKKIIRSMKKEHIIIFSTHILQLATDLCDELVILNEGKLDLVDHKMLQDNQFEEKIIQILKDDDYA